MDTLILLRRGQEVRRFPLGSEIVEVGSAPSCDVCVDEPQVPDRAVLIHATRGSVFVYTLSERPLKPRVLPYDGELPLGREHTLKRVRAHVGQSPVRGNTLSTVQLEPVTRWTLLVGRGADARRMTISALPVRVGSADQDNDLTLSDRTVSAHHCRLEPTGKELVVRDLDSRNGTYLDGVRIDRARVRSGATLRVGRTDLHLLGACDEGSAPSSFVAVSSAMQQVLSEVENLAPLSWPALVLGPSGAGKEEVAARLHQASARSRGPFVALNAGGLPPNLVESELFGHERGAFTGASVQHRGVFEQAEGGTLFLDEIGELPLELQARLLRVLETWKVRRVGAERDTPVDLRLVCATHRDLVSMVREGSFREDLYYRLNRLVVRVPPLREREADVVPLAEHFLKQASHEIGHRELTREARAALLAHNWPGNVRELRNVVCAAAAMSAGAGLDAADIDRALRRLGSAQPTRQDPGSLKRAVAQYGGNVSAAARALGLPRSTLRDRLRA